MTIRKGHIDDLAELQQLLVDTVFNVCKVDYNSDQISVWTSSIENEKRWRDILTNQFVLVAQDRKKIVGFCTLDNGNYIDLLYIHQNYQRQGIARKLYADIEKEARRQRQTELTSDVSKTARPFFEIVGFKMLKEQSISLKGVELTNYKMTKGLE